MNQIVRDEIDYQQRRFYRRLKKRGKLVVEFWPGAKKFLNSIPGIAWEKQGNKILIKEKVSAMKTYREILEAVPKGGRQHTPGSLKSFAKRSSREGKRYLDVHNDPNSAFNRHVNALKKHQAVWTKLEGMGIYRVPGSKIAALPANDKKSSPQWIVFDVDTREELTQLKKKEVLVYLSKYAVDNEGMK